MSLQRRLDSLIANFTREILEVIGRANLSEIAPGRIPGKLARTQKPAPKGRKAPEPKAAAPKPAPAAPARVPRKVVAAAAPAPEPAPDARTLERMLLGALRGAAPMNREDVLDSAGIGGDHLESARKVLDGLVERGVIGSANLSGSPLLFIKPSQTTRRRARKEKPASVVVAAQPAPEPWKPTVIRRKKTTAEDSQADFTPANDGNTPPA
ncbi:MAG: hypothetical protein ACXVEF_11390 [Polyangiales bacterium]